jgi:hypothetical protein
VIKLAAFTICVLQACRPPDDDYSNGLPVIVQLTYSRSGEDLLNPSTPSGFSFDKIELFNVEKGHNVPLYNSNLASPSYCALTDSAGQYRLLVYPQGEVTLLQLNKTTFDTLSYLIKGSKIQIWYNSNWVIENARLNQVYSFEILK